MIILKKNDEELAQKFRKHILKDPLISQFPEVRGRIMELPICPNCERPALRDTRPYDPELHGMYITCPSCGYHGRKAHSVEYHLENHVIDNSYR